MRLSEVWHGYSVGNIRQKGQDLWVGAVGERTHAAVAHEEMTKARVIAAESRIRIRPGLHQGIARPGGAARANPVIAVVQRTVQGAGTPAALGNVLLADEERVAQTVADFLELDGADLGSDSAANKSRSRLSSWCLPDEEYATVMDSLNIGGTGQPFHKKVKRSLRREVLALDFLSGGIGIPW